VSGRRLTPGELADFCGVSVTTIRRAEKDKLIPKANRDWNNYRYWTEEEAEKIKRLIESPKPKKKSA
jgi:DNA-binding transcriptional MerR regulator